MEKIKKFFLGDREPAYSNKLPNQMVLSCRALVGGYLLYLSKGLADDIIKKASEKMPVLLAASTAVFALVGAVLLYDCIRNFVIGRYVGGKLDLGENPEVTLDGKDAEDFDEIITEDEALEESVTGEEDE